jgi:hypothetical protein
MPIIIIIIIIKKKKNRLPGLDNQVSTETGWLLYNRVLAYPVLIFQNKKKKKNQIPKF